MIEAHDISRLINRDPDIMSGTPVFMGTRVPVQILFNWLEDGEYSLDDFLENFPSVAREQAIAVLEVYKDLLLAEVE
jgi:uncharacterized protein (DUF433 family)